MRLIVTAELVAQIELLLGAGVTQADIALQVGVSQGTVHNVKQGRYAKRLMRDARSRDLIAAARDAVDTMRADDAMDRLAAMYARSAASQPAPEAEDPTPEVGSDGLTPDQRFSAMRAAQHSAQRQAQEKIEGEK